MDDGQGGACVPWLSLNPCEVAFVQGDMELALG